jgi:Na+/H+ antiporter NhaC
MIFALLPSLLALVLSLILGNATIALGAGALLGAILVNWQSLEALPLYALEAFVLQALASSWKLGAILLTLQLGAFSSLLDINGNLLRIFKSLNSKNKIPDRKRSLTALSTMGLICFYDGLANSILLGRISQSLTRQYKVSRELLAYIVDSTSSAVACLVVFSTWTAFQLGLIQDNLPANYPASPMELLIRSIPYNAYSWISLTLLFVVIRKDLFWGPMRRFEEKAAPASSPQTIEDHESMPPLSLGRALAPLFVLFGSFLLICSLQALLNSSTNFFNAFHLALASNEVPWYLNVAAALSILTSLFWRASSVSFTHALRSAREGLTAISKPLLILLCAWALSKAISDLGAAQYLAVLFQKSHVSLPWLPLMSFAVACVVSFLTGTSWGTLGLMMPLALPLLAHLDNPSPSLAQAIIGAILGGAVFGDHCSPISDTTVVSAFATGSTVRNHALSQLPYAVIAALLALLLVYLPFAIF